MASFFTISLLTHVLFSAFVVSPAQICSNKTFSPYKIYNSCIDLPSLGSFLHWNYLPSTGKVSIAYRVDQVSDGWIAWAINPTGIGMVDRILHGQSIRQALAWSIGSQALVAFRKADGNMTAYTTLVTSYNPPMLPAELSFEVSHMSVEYSDNEMIIFAVVGLFENGTSVSHVWQAGPVISNTPLIHPPSPANLESMGKIDFASI